MIRLMHVSDLHFGKNKDGNSTHRFVSGKEPEPLHLVDTLARHCKSPPDAFIVSGDIAWKGTQDDYAYATTFLKQLRHRWPDTAFVVAPGNHDVDISAQPPSQHNFRAFLEEFDPEAFRVQFLLVPTIGEERRALISFQVVKSTGGEELLIVAANSAAYVGLTDGHTLPQGSQKKARKDSPVGFTAADFKALEGVLDSRFKDIKMRIFVLHHALFPFAEPSWTPNFDLHTITERPDHTVVANSAILQCWLADHQFSVALHGHKHSMHARSDRLWRRGSPKHGSEILIVGAGSTGVEQEHRGHNEPLSFNEIELTRLSNHRWWAQVHVTEVPDPPARPSCADSFGLELGCGEDKLPWLFHAESIVDCHRAIDLRCRGEKLITNFISVVDDCSFQVPPTARNGGHPVTLSNIKSTFSALHPEHENTGSWTDLDRIHEVIRPLSGQIQFQHGPRLFDRAQGTGISVIERALDHLERATHADAYAGLYRPQIDVTTAKDALTPHLMGLQFIADGDSLDLVATFRKVELSYWWVANMYELSELLTWAATKRGGTRRKPRRITIFAAFAEWKLTPTAAFAARIDKLSIQEALRILIGLDRGDAEAPKELTSLLQEKLEATSDRNLDGRGLETLHSVLQGLLNTQSGAKKPKNTKIPRQLVEKIKAACDSIRKAVEAPDSFASVQAEHVQRALQEAISLLEPAK